MIDPDKKGKWYYLEASVWIPEDHYPPYKWSELLNDNLVRIDDVRVFEYTTYEDAPNEVQ